MKDSLDNDIQDLITIFMVGGSILISGCWLFPVSYSRKLATMCILTLFSQAVWQQSCKLPLGSFSRTCFMTDVHHIRSNNLSFKVWALYFSSNIYTSNDICTDTCASNDIHNITIKLFQFVHP